jgi:hypothetical protein
MVEIERNNAQAIGSMADVGMPRAISVQKKSPAEARLKDLLSPGWFT